MAESNFVYKINPCYACYNKFKHQSSSPDVNEINNCCSETLGAFKGNASINAFRNSEAAQNCVQCVNNNILGTGRTTCDMRLTMAPTFAQVPHFFPDIFNEVKDVEKARLLCLEKCKTSPYPNSCITNCNTDSSAVVYDKFKKEFFSGVM